MSQKRTSTIIELYGAPGVGKSSLAKRLAERGAVVVSPNLKKHHYLWLPFYYPQSVLYWSLLIIKNFVKKPSIGILTFNFSLLFSSLQKMHDALNTKAALVVIDESLVQRFLSYSDVVHKQNTISKLLEKSLKGDLIILVNDRVATSRRYDASHVRAKQGEAYLASWKQNLEVNLGNLKEVISANKTLRHFETAQISIDDILKSI